MDDLRLFLDRSFSSVIFPNFFYFPNSHESGGKGGKKFCEIGTVCSRVLECGYACGRYEESLGRSRVCREDCSIRDT